MIKRWIFINLKYLGAEQGSLASVSSIPLFYFGNFFLPLPQCLPVFPPHSRELLTYSPTPEAWQILVEEGREEEKYASVPMSEQGTGGARENRAVIFGEGRIPGAKTFVLMEFEGREACVFVDRRVDHRWREFTRFCFTVYFILSLPLRAVIVHG